jgi:hypothetical protein
LEVFTYVMNLCLPKFWLVFGGNAFRRYNEKKLNLLLLYVITFMLGTYNYIPGTNVTRVYTVAAILLLQFMVHVNDKRFVLLH